MSGFIKWVGIILGILLGLILVAIAFLYIVTDNRLNRRYDIQVETLVVPENEASIAHGEHLVKALLLCQECHGEDLSGFEIDEGPWVATFSMSNLTSGKGGIGQTYTNEDWVRAIRHGVGNDNKALIVMPSPLYYFLSDKDLASVIAYLKSVPPVDNEMPEKRLGPLGRFFILTDPELIGAEAIDHTAPRPATIPQGATVEYGEYLANTCKSCHGEDLGGGEQVGAGLNLTPGGELANWSFEDFERVMRVGLTPEDRQISPEDMPWMNFKNLSDMELEALWLYLQSLPPVASPPATP
jgi:mono/diheme cytochrome c family protein